MLQLNEGFTQEKDVHDVDLPQSAPKENLDPFDSSSSPFFGGEIAQM
jgi:hypothetical protein